MIRKLGWLVFLIAALAAAGYLAYKIASPYLWPLPFEGPYRGAVLGAGDRSPVQGAEVEAAWLIHDNPLPDGPGHHHFRRIVRTDAKGRFEIEKPFHRRGFFGTEFVLSVRAPGYIEKVFILDPRNTPLPSSTAAYPFTETAVKTSFPETMDVVLNPAKPVLLMVLSSGTEPWLRSEAAAGLGNLAPLFAEEAVPALIKALSDADPAVREQAATALGSYGPAAAPAVPDLIEKLNDPNEWVRRKAAGALGRIGPAAAPAAPALVEALLNDPERTIRQAAAEALGEIGPAASQAVPALKQALSDPEGWVGHEARRALEKIVAGE